MNATPCTVVPSVQPDPVSARSDGQPDLDELVLKHLWLADSMARRFRSRGEDDDDLRQVARCGLLEAAHRYDPAQGPFAPFAAPTITGILKRHFRDHGWAVRPPRQTQQLAVQILQQWSDIAQQRAKLPTDLDLADSLDESVVAVREAQCAAQGYRTVDLEGLRPSSASPAGDDPEMSRCEARLLVQGTWKRLNDDERNLLRMRFWERQSQAKIAARLGISQMQVSRLLTRVLHRLRDQLTDEDDYHPRTAGEQPTSRSVA